MAAAGATSVRISSASEVNGPPPKLGLNPYNWTRSPAETEMFSEKLNVPAVVTERNVPTAEPFR